MPDIITQKHMQLLGDEYLSFQSVHSLVPEATDFPHHEQSD